jgi:O-antigen/teichoic acid export membrane protein
MTIEAYIWMFANSLNGLFLPKVTRMVTKTDNREEVTNLMIRVGRIQLLVIGPLITGIVVLGKSFIILWMGKNFEPSYYVTLCLIIPGIIILTQEIALTLLFVVNELKYRAILFISASIISVIIGSLLASKFGAIGTAIGVALALIICHVIGMNIMYSKILKLDIMRFFKSCHLRMIWPMIFAGIVSVVLQYFYPILGWGSFIISGSLYAFIFFILTWKLTMNMEEKHLALEIINKMKKSINY